MSSMKAEPNSFMISINFAAISKLSSKQQVVFYIHNLLHVVTQNEINDDS